jgi:hypothetical protein
VPWIEVNCWMVRGIALGRIGARRRCVGNRLRLCENPLPDRWLLA